MASSSTPKAQGWWSSSSIPPIPDGLGDNDKPVYRTLLDVREQRELRNESSPNVMVITGIAKDYDDLATMVVLKELHRLGLVRLFGFVANLYPADQRALYGKGALKSLSLAHIETAKGTDALGISPSGKSIPKPVRVEHAYEFTASFYTELVKDRSGREARKKGSQVLTDICQEENDAGRKVNPILFKSVVKNVVLQGGNTSDPLTANLEAANNKFDWDAAKGFHAIMSGWDIRSIAYTKHAAIPSSLKIEDFADLAGTGHVIGQHLQEVHSEQEKDQWDYLNDKTSWYEFHRKAEELVDPKKDRDVIDKYLTEVVLYDALAAIGAAGQDILTALKIKDEKTDVHEVVGRKGPGKPGPDHIPEIEVENMNVALRALLKGSVLASMQGMPSSP